MSQAPNIPSGWHLDEESGCLMRDTIHHMGRRCRNWDYCGRGCYLITITLADRSRPLLGECVRSPIESVRSPIESVRSPIESVRSPIESVRSPIESVRSPINGREKDSSIDGQALFVPTELGRRVEAHACRIPEFSPEIEVLGVQCMPEHLHMVLRVRCKMEKPLGEHLRGFKIGCTKIARSAVHSPIYGRVQGEAARGKGLFADGFVDTILFDDGAVKRGIDYMRDNPRRLLEKREHPEYFRVVRRLRRVIDDAGVRSPIHGREFAFSALGNQTLLDAPMLAQVQCSRHFFAYARDAAGNILRDSPPVLCTEEFEEKCADLLAAAAHGAVLVESVHFPWRKGNRPSRSCGRRAARRLKEQGLRSAPKAGRPPLRHLRGRSATSPRPGRLALPARRKAHDT